MSEESITQSFEAPPLLTRRMFSISKRRGM